MTLGVARKDNACDARAVRYLSRDRKSTPAAAGASVAAIGLCYPRTTIDIVSDRAHDLGLFSVGPEAPRPPRGSVGLYHLAWEVPTIEDLASAASVLGDAGALGGASDHGVSKSLYGSDPDGNEFEIMWRVPREAWGEYESKGVVMPLDLDAEVKRWGAPGAARA
ncbi:MAG: VOC family protein [Candidatus Limnocylindrales bacterium]